MSRYTNKRIFQANRTPAAKDILRSRDLVNTRLIETALTQPLSVEERKKYSMRTSIWQRRTRLFKLAFEFYGDSKLWWIIAWFNQKPTDAHFSVGDEVLIPFPLEQIFERLI
jgi:competence CoiA-like predicted nuclease